MLPSPRVSVAGTLLVPGALALFGGPIFGWAKPVPVRGDRLRDPRFGMVAVAAAGPGTNLLLALVGAVLFGAVSGAIIAAGAVPPDWLLSAGGMFILINRPFLVGDTVSVAGVTGEILEVNLAACIIFSTEHETVTVPNAKVWGNPIRNVSRNTKQV